jgi:putative hydrolases of HD superfamily
MSNPTIAGSVQESEDHRQPHQSAPHQTDGYPVERPEIRDIDGLVEFLREIDQLKSIERRSWLMDGSRRENSAEHSWHIALMALILAPYANQPVNVDRVVRMLLIHDLVEIYAGDTFAYDRTGRSEAAQREEEAARQLFAMLPETSREELLALWQEFEARETPEARFAKAMDRFMPLLHNYFTQGTTWREYDVSLEQVLDLNRCINESSSTLWAYVQTLLSRAVDAGYLADKSPTPAQSADAITHSVLPNRGV